MDDEIKAALLEILGITDAIFAPLRGYSMNDKLHMNGIEARRRFARGGVPWRGGGSGADRAAAGRLVDRLHKSKLMHVRRSKNNAAPLVKLSEVAETWGRAACGLPSLLGGWEALEFIAGLSSQADTKAVPEWAIAGWPKHRGAQPGTQDMKDLVFIEDLALPALCRGWLDSGSSVRGHVSYWTLPAGLAALAKGIPAKWLPSDPGKFNAELEQAYLAVFETERGRLSTATPDNNRDIGPIPLIESVPWPGPVGKALWDDDTAVALT